MTSRATHPTTVRGAAEMELPSCSLAYTGNSVCGKLVNYPVYLFTSSPTQVTRSEALVNGFAFMMTLVPHSSVDSFFRLLCYTAFPRYGHFGLHHSI